MEQENKMQAFAYGDQMVRTIEREDGTWWVLKDVCRALLLDSTQLKKVADRLDGDEKGRIQITTPGGNQETWIVNEPGLYSVVLRSDKPQAKTFKRWITHEVLPQIRKTGGYGNIGMEQIGQMIQQTAVAVAAEFAKQIVPILTDVISSMKNPPAKEDSTVSLPQMQFAALELNSAPRYKIDTFPTEIHSQIDSLLDEMEETQSLNFLRISRFCTLSGHPLSSPAIKEYYVRRNKGE